MFPRHPYVSCYYFLCSSNAGCGTAELERIYSSSHTEFLHNLQDLAAVHSYNLYLPNFFHSLVLAQNPEMEIQQSMGTRQTIGGKM